MPANPDLSADVSPDVPSSGQDAQSASPNTTPIDAREKQIALGLLAAFLLFIIAPYIWAWAITPPGMTWTGLLFSADDQNVHLMWARQAQDGAFFFRDQFTTEGLISGDKALFWNVLPALMGWFSRLTGLEVGFPYHIFRVSLAALAFWQTHELAKAATNDAPEKASARLWTLALFAFSSGIGFLASVFPSLLSNFFFLDLPDNAGYALVPEGFASLSALFFPLNMAGFALLAFIFTNLVRDRWPLATFVGALFLSNIHTYDAIPLILVSVVGLVLNRKWRVPLAAIVGAGLPVLYQLVVFRGSEEFRLKALTHTIFDSPIPVVLAYSPLLILGFWGWKNVVDKKARTWLALWAVTAIVCACAPAQVFTFARKMLEGAQIPLLIFAGLGLAKIAKKPIIGVFLVVILAISPLSVFGWALSNAGENNASRWRFQLPPLYLSDADMGALRTLNKAPKEGAVLCLPLLGAYVPRATGQFVYIGHWAETLHFGKKFTQTSHFFRGEMTDDEARQFLKENRIRFVLESPFERAIGEGQPSMAQKLGLRSIYSAQSPTGLTQVFEVS